MCKVSKNNGHYILKKEKKHDKTFFVDIFVFLCCNIRVSDLVLRLFWGVCGIVRWEWQFWGCSRKKSFTKKSDISDMIVAMCLMSVG